MTIPATVAPTSIVPATFRQQGQDNPYQRERNNDDESRQRLQSRGDRQAAGFILRGELVDAAVQQRRGRRQPDQQPNQQIAPQNRTAIESYLASDDLTGRHDPRGRLLDRYV